MSSEIGGRHSSVTHQEAVNGKNVQNVYRMGKPFADMRNEVEAAGWRQERSAQGYRMVHADLGATAWHRQPYHAVDEAATISAPPPDYTAPEGY